MRKKDRSRIICRLFLPKASWICLSLSENPATRFVKKYRQQIFPSVPAVFMGVEQRRVPRDSLTKDDALVVIANDFIAIVDNILTVLQHTTNIVIILGNSPQKQYWWGR